MSINYCFHVSRTFFHVKPYNMKQKVLNATDFKDAELTDCDSLIHSGATSWQAVKPS